MEIQNFTISEPEVTNTTEKMEPEVPKIMEQTTLEITTTSPETTTSMGKIQTLAGVRVRTTSRSSAIYSRLQGTLLGTVLLLSLL